MSLSSPTNYSPNHSSSESPPPPPPWEVLLFLVSHHLDPKTLAIASCVCKSWSLSISSDHLWQPISTAHFPSLSSLRSVDPAIPFRRLYAIGLAALKRRARNPVKPRLCLDDLVFVVDLLSFQNLPIVTMAKPGNEIAPDPNGLFRFDFSMDDSCVPAAMRQATDPIKVRWNVALKELKAAFTMMESCGGNTSITHTHDAWYSQELPSPGCCCCTGAAAKTKSTMVADMKLEFCREGKSWGRMKVSVGILSSAGDWRYVSLDDGLRYLQNFLAV